MTNPNQTKLSPMVRIADLLHRVLKLARKRWYVTLVIALVIGIPSSRLIYRMSKIKKMIVQMKEDNPQVKDWSRSFVTLDDHTTQIHFNESGNMYHYFDFRYASLSDLNIFLAETSLKDISALEGMPLKSIDLGTTTVSDISVLKGMPLEVVWLYRTNVSNITVLEGMSLKQLSVAYTQVEDISVLKGMHLNSLHIQNTKLSDISALKGMTLYELYLPKTAKDIEFLRSMKTLQMINTKSSNDFWKEYDAQKKSESKTTEHAVR